jgi:hypothetical protein
MYNRVHDGNLEKQCEQKAKLLNNLDLMDSWLIRSAAKQAKWINDTNKDKVVVFGGRKNLIRRAKGLMTKEEFLSKGYNQLILLGKLYRKETENSD